MKRSLLLVALAVAVPMTHIEAQRSRSKKDSSSTPVQALAAGASIGTGLLALFIEDDDAYAGPSAWCVGSCAPTRRSSAQLLDKGGRSLWLLSDDALESAPPLRRLGFRMGVAESLAEALRQGGFGQPAAALAVRMETSSMALQSSSATPTATREPEPSLVTTAAMVTSTSGTGCSLGECGTTPDPVTMSGGSDAFVASVLALEASVLAPVVAADIIVNPEPGTIMLTLSGLACLLLVRRRTRTTR
jgi:hypothetical protein